MGNGHKPTKDMQKIARLSIFSPGWYTASLSPDLLHSLPSGLDMRAPDLGIYDIGHSDEWRAEKWASCGGAWLFAVPNCQPDMHLSPAPQSYWTLPVLVTLHHPPHSDQPLKTEIQWIAEKFLSGVKLGQCHWIGEIPALMKSMLNLSLTTVRPGFLLSMWKTM